MTLQQLRYVIQVVESGSFNSAAKALFISQPSLSKSIHDLEEEMSICLFVRTNKGILLSEQGEKFLGYARQVIEQANLLEEHIPCKNCICDFKSTLCLCGKCVCRLSQRIQSK